MKYKIGEKFYLINKQGQAIETEIIEIKFVLNRRLGINGQSNYCSEKDLDIALARGYITKDNKQDIEIALLETKYGIKLEVKNETK